MEGVEVPGGGSQDPQGAPEGGVGEMIPERVSQFESSLARQGDFDGF